MENLENLINKLKTSLDDLQYYAGRNRDENTGCNDAYAQGIELACEEIENILEIAEKFLKDEEIESVKNKVIQVSPKQKKLL